MIVKLRRVLIAHPISRPTRNPRRAAGLGPGGGVNAKPEQGTGGPPLEQSFEVDGVICLRGSERQRVKFGRTGACRGLPAANRGGGVSQPAIKSRFDRRPT